MSSFRYLCLFLVALSFFAFGTIAFADNNEGPVSAGAVAAEAVSLTNATRGQVLCTAAINSDGSVANCYSCVKDVSKTFKVATGQYQVTFQGICDYAQASKGWSRWVQVDTLSTGTITGVSCSTADRVGTTNAVWVNCFNGTGADVDASFFLFLAK